MTEIFIEEIPTSSGDITIELNGYLLHSKYNPRKEAEIFAKNNYKPDSIMILFGYGKGYILEELLKISDSERIIVVDPYFEIDIKNPRVEFIKINKELNFENDIAKYISVKDNCNIIVSPNYEKIFKEEYVLLLKAVKNTLFINKVFENTLIASSLDWHRNFIFNLKYIINDESLSSIMNSTNKSVVIASGGPSLTKQLDLLKHNRNKVLLIASGSTVGSLMKADIEPDYVVSIDGSIENVGHFENLQFKHARFIYAMQSHYEIRKKFSKSYYFLQAYSGRYKSYLEKIVKKEVPVLLGGGSVAHFALAIATTISSGKIALIGQDLAFTGGHTHALGNKGNKTVNVKNPNYLEVEGYWDDKVYTDYSFFSMKKTFEDMREYMRDRKDVFNCTEGGVKLKGYEQISFSSFLESIEQDEEEYHFVHESGSNDSTILLNELRNELKSGKEIVKNIKKNIIILKKVEINNYFLKKDLIGLDKNDKKIKKLLLNTTFQILTAPIDVQVQKYFSEQLEENKETQFNRVLKQNKALYNGYLMVMNQGLENMESLIKELESEK